LLAGEELMQILSVKLLYTKKQQSKKLKGLIKSRPSTGLKTASAASRVLSGGIKNAVTCYLSFL
jgi:hypothetical protein